MDGVGGLNVNPGCTMNLQAIKDFFSNLSVHHLPTGVVILIAITLLFLIFKTGELLMKAFLFLVAVALFAGAYWWHHHN